MSFVSRQAVRFAHCDAAGIVFYPRYFEMLNAAVEDWFAADLGLSFAEMHGERRMGIPTRKLDSEFLAPSRLGEEIDIGIVIARLGTSSCAIDVTMSVGQEVRARVHVVLVCMNLDSGRAIAWPDDVRSRMIPVEVAG